MNASIIQSMIDAIDKPAIFITPDYVIRAVNQLYRDTYATPVIQGTSTCYQISHQNDRPCDACGEECPIAKCKSTGKAANVVHIHSTPRGKTFCDIIMKPVWDDTGELYGYLEILDRLGFASTESGQHKMVGQSDAFRHLLNKINRVAQSEIAVLLQGETGTGKELVAQAIHQASRRHTQPFVIIECTGLTDSLFESELFGYEKGAFTGASTSKKGLVETANGGTLFFDEIADVPLSMQVKLLRLLETQSFRPVGGLKQKRADFRLVCASHKNLLAMVDNGEFRQDLYYRIAGFTVPLPALRERRDDIRLLSEHFLSLSEYADKVFTEEALVLLEQYAFPGNIRELRNIVEQSALLANESSIHTTDLPPQVLQQQELSVSAQMPSWKEVLPLEKAEEAYLQHLCQTFKGDADTLARLLHISTRTLYRKLQRYGLRLTQHGPKGVL